MFLSRATVSKQLVMLRYVNFPARSRSERDAKREKVREVSDWRVKRNKTPYLDLLVELKRAESEWIFELILFVSFPVSCQLLVRVLGESF